MSPYTLFQMGDADRQSLINRHLFYVNQARKRLLSQFDDIESEANQASEEWLSKNSHRFNPDKHDEGSFLESAHEVGIEFYQLLSNLLDRTRLSVVAGMYYEWDKSFRKWLVGEIQHWHTGNSAQAKVWTVDFGKLIDLLEGLGWLVRNQDYYNTLDACRLLVNVYKHGEGNSLDHLKKAHPEYLTDPFSDIGGSFLGIDHLDHTHLFVSNAQLQDFSDAIVAFWNDVPETIVNHDGLEPPDWFEKAIALDQDATNHQQGSTSL